MFCHIFRIKYSMIHILLLFFGKWKWDLVPFLLAMTEQKASVSVVSFSRLSRQCLLRKCLLRQYLLYCRRYMAEILPKWRKTLSNQSINQRQCITYRNIGWWMRQSKYFLKYLRCIFTYRSCVHFDREYTVWLIKIFNI